MPVAITLTLDRITAAQVSKLADALPDCLPRSGYPAHLTLAVYGDSVDVRDLDAALATCTGCWKRLPITLAAIGIFPPSTLWLGPVPAAELIGRHTTLHKALADIPCHPHFQIGTWMPHVTLGTSALVNDAVEVLTLSWMGQIVGWLDSLDLVRFDPVEVLSRRPLRA